MKKLILMALLCASPAAAEEHICQSLGELAEVVMEIRQNGIPMSQTMGVLSQMDEEVRDSASAMIRMAYDAPMFTSDQYQGRAIVEFRDRIEVLCFKSRLGE